MQLKNKKPLLTSGLISLLLIAAIILVAVFTLISGRSSSASVAGFDPGNIISDFVMSNKNSMTEAQIQSFLKSKNPCNDTNLAKANAYQHLGYSIKDGHFVCMADESFNGESAAHIIWQASQDYSINPQVLIVLLEKEQGLVTDTWPNKNIQYRSATGFGCPDSADCDSKYFGFKNQIRHAAALFREVLDGGWSNYPVGWNYIQYNPDKNCGGSDVYVKNRATSALYRYTPYQPHQAALNSGGKEVTCGAYGNRNFYVFFINWFGLPNGTSYASGSNKVSLFKDESLSQPLNTRNGRYVVNEGQDFYIKVSATNIGIGVWPTNIRVGTDSPKDRTSVFKSDSWISSNRLSSAGSTAAYQEVAEFTAKLTAPTKTGSYTEKFALVIEGKTWINNSSISLPITVESTTEKVLLSDTINPEEILEAKGDYLVSTNGASVVKINKGALEVQTRFKKTWDSDTYDSDAKKLVLQSDGNLVLYGETSVLWSSETHGTDANRLVLQSDGNLVLYGKTKALWSSGTYVPNLTNPTLKTEEIAITGQRLFVGDGSLYLTLQSDGNLVLYRKNKGALWSSKTYGTDANRLVLQSDGNLVLYGKTKALWSSGTYSK